jgi:ATP-binding protein involved in chromosome partitioning
MKSECDGKSDFCSKTEGCNDPRRQSYEREQSLKLRMSKIRHKIAVISGKGGVGKSTVTVNLAVAFAMRGYANSVGILDADIHGPCVPNMLGLKGRRLLPDPEGMLPVIGPLGIKVVSMAFLLPNDEAPVIWRGPLKMVAIEQFLSDTVWGELEFLFIDLPPGTGDEPLSIMQLIPNMDGVVIVTTPNRVAQDVVKKAVTFAKQLNIPIVGIIENMNSFICPKCGQQTDIFKAGGGQQMATGLSVPFLGSIPIDPRICQDSDDGTPFIIKHADSAATNAFTEITKRIEHFLENRKKVESTQTKASQGIKQPNHSEISPRSTEMW